MLRKAAMNASNITPPAATGLGGVARRNRRTAHDSKGARGFAHVPEVMRDLRPIPLPGGGPTLELHGQYRGETLFAMRGLPHLAGCGGGGPGLIAAPRIAGARRGRLARVRRRLRGAGAGAVVAYWTASPRR